MKKIYLPIICLAIALFFSAFLWKVPEWQIASSKGLTAKERIELENDTRRTWAQILGGVFFLITAYFTWRRVTIAQEEQITDRFAKAIEHLGDKNHLEVRLGGIYALERIARDSKKDHWTIMEVLTAYVREKAPWTEAGETEESRKGEEEKSKNSGESSWLPTAKKPPADIQAILTVLGRRTLAHEKGEDRKLSLSETDLQGANLSGAHLEGVVLSLAHLEEADLTHAHLEQVKLYRAHLEKADLGGAHLRRAERLTIKQLSKVRTLFTARLEPELMEQVAREHPHLLEEPKREK